MAEEGDALLLRLRLPDGRTRRDCAVAVTRHGHSLLHHAAEHDDAKLVGALLRCGAPVAAKDAWGRTPLALALGAGATRTVALLLSKGASADLKTAPFNRARRSAPGEPLDKAIDAFDAEPLEGRPEVVAAADAASPT